MSNLTDRRGGKVPFLTIAIPCWIDSLFAFGMIGHTLYLESSRPLSPAPANGFVIAQTVNRTTHYLSQADRLINAALWVLVFMSAAATVIYFWRIGIFSPRRSSTKA